MKKQIVLTIALLVGLFSASNANNININNVVLTNQNTGVNTTHIKFDISWENSWRTSTNESNMDGAWVFCKFRKKNGYAWQHATLNYVSPGTAAASGHIAPAGSELQSSADGKGAWMYRNADGLGNVNWTGAELIWNYGADGVADGDSVEMKVYATEMVYVTQGEFFLGSNGAESYHLRRADKDTAYLVTSENAITVGGTSANNIATGSYMTGGTIPAAYPKGYNAFWLMKYEASQQQYADFLASLDNARAAIRNNAVATGTHPAYTVPFPERAMNLISHDDALAYMDWAAMRPFTELEFEKACRGKNMVPVANEYAWGNTSYIAATTASIVNGGTDAETFGVGNINASLPGGNVSRPVRCGAFATSTSNRANSGAGFYGAMELSGNLWEFVVNADISARAAFTGAHGDGELSNVALCNATGWSAGIGGLKGASYADIYADYFQTSCRQSCTPINSRQINFGFRAARTAE
jgi:formylglycine-generating enzyme required for sulfatase activity